MEVDLQSLFGLHVTWCTQLYSLAETPQLPPYLDSDTRALLISKHRRHLFVTPWFYALCQPVWGDQAGRPGVPEPGPAPRRHSGEQHQHVLRELQRHLLCQLESQPGQHCPRGQRIPGRVRVTKLQCCVSMAFWCGSGSADLYRCLMDPDPAIYVIDLQDATKKLIFLKKDSAYYFLKVHLHHFLKMSHKKVRIKFSYYCCLMII